MSEIIFGNSLIGKDHPVYICAEIGINHNGDLDLAKRMITAAKESGANGVKFQKRTPSLCVPKAEWNKLKKTPWGEMTYIDYKERIEFGKEEYQELFDHAIGSDIDLFASPWDLESAHFLTQFDIPGFKIASASITNIGLLNYIHKTQLPVIMSTGMSTEEEIDHAFETLYSAVNPIIICHCTSSYPTKFHELNLNMIKTLQNNYEGHIIGYSGHEKGIAMSTAAVAMGAKFIERHFTLDRTMWGTDQAASLEPKWFKDMVRDIRNLEEAMGDGVKRVYESEKPIREKLRG